MKERTTAGRAIEALLTLRAAAKAFRVKNMLVVVVQLNLADSRMLFVVNSRLSLELVVMRLCGLAKVLSLNYKATILGGVNSSFIVSNSLKLLIAPAWTRRLLFRSLRVH